MRTSSRTVAWWSAPLAPVALVAGFLLAQSRQPPAFDPVRDTLSSLATHPAADPWIMTAGFVVLGVCHVVTSIGLPAAGVPARAGLALGGVATLVVAASPQPAALHVPAASVAFVALALWPALTPPGWRRVGVPLTLVNLALLVWFAVELRSGSYGGLSERAAAVGEALAPIAVLVVRARSTGRDRSAPRAARRDGR